MSLLAQSKFLSVLSSLMNLIQQPITKVKSFEPNCTILFERFYIVIIRRSSTEYIVSGLRWDERSSVYKEWAFASSVTYASHASESKVFAWPNYIPKLMKKVMNWDKQSNTKFELLSSSSFAFSSLD